MNNGLWIIIADCTAFSIFYYLFSINKMLCNRSMSSAESPIPFFRYACMLPYSVSICSLAAFRKSSLAE